MTTKNLADNSSLVQAAIAEMEAIEARAAEVERLAEENEKKRQETESQRDASLRALEIASRRVRQQAKDNLAELEEELEVIDEEAGQLAYILTGESDNEPVAPAPVSEPEPVPAPVVPEASAPEPPTRLFDDLADREPDEQAPANTNVNNVNVFVATYRWVQDFTVLQWVLALIGALIGFYLGVAHHGFNHSVPGIGKALVAIVWTVGLTLLGFGLGGFIGGLLHRNREVVV